jgi:hypothetical protein
MYPWTVITHPKYSSVTKLLIINVILVGMNGSLLFQASKELIFKQSIEMNNIQPFL